MHIGNLRTALYAYLYAKHNGGKFIIRIEDTDQGRYVEGAVDVIFNTLKEAGIDYVYQSVYELTLSCLIRLLGT